MITTFGYGLSQKTWLHDYTHINHSSHPSYDMVSAPPPSPYDSPSVFFVPAMSMPIGTFT